MSHDLDVINTALRLGDRFVPSVMRRVPSARAASLRAGMVIIVSLFEMAEVPGEARPLAEWERLG